MIRRSASFDNTEIEAIVERAKHLVAMEAEQAFYGGYKQRIDETLAELKEHNLTNDATYAKLVILGNEVVKLANQRN